MAYRTAGTFGRSFFMFAIAIAALIAGGCASKPSDNVMIADARAAVVRFVDSDPGLQDWVNHAHGYAVFPSMNKGGFGVGGVQAAIPQRIHRISSELRS